MVLGLEANESPSAIHMTGMSGAEPQPADAFSPQDQSPALSDHVNVATMPGAENMDLQREEKPRGRERDRRGSGVVGGDESDAGGQNVPTRKRRRSRKGLERKFECPHPGCGKFYSRAEHLYRHQLNHQPKQIYFCDFADCKRSFVRQDLCTRHRERHTNRGSHLQRKDSFLNNPSPALVRSVQERRGSVAIKDSSSPESGIHSVAKEESPARVANGIGPTEHEGQAKIRRTSAESAPAERLRRASMAHDPTYGSAANNLNDGSPMYGTAGHPQIPPLSIPPLPGNPTAVQTPTTNMRGLTLQSPAFSTSTVASQAPYPANTTSASMSGNTGVPLNPANGPTQFTSQAGYHTNFTTLPQPAYPELARPPNPTSGQYIAVGNSTSIDPATIAATTGMDIDTMTYTMPVFGDSGYNRSPHWGGAYSGAWLDFLMGTDVGNGQDLASALFETAGESSNPQENFYVQGPEGFPGTFLAHPMGTHPMNINTIAPPSPPQEALLSEDKRQRLLDSIDSFGGMQQQFPEGIAGGPNSEDDRHPLSLSMMQTYISLYWMHFHPQLPILHRPTFSADKTPEILLLCIIVIGAACMDFKADATAAQEAAEFANIIANSVRWAIFAEEDFRPPAKLWVFQALLLLETYEKMFADRKLHERAHIHHATTLTLMRRGSSLTGRSGAFDSPQSGRDAKSDGSSVTFSGQPGAGTANSNDESWNRWIVQEATKRVAFAAFILDSTHATMFGHSAVMVAHEMRLQLPCDETLWAATSWSEVWNIRQTLTQNNVQTPYFLEGLKKILSGQPVNTNSFGRTILMAGLLSVAWHLNQRDIQVSSLGAVPQLGGKDKWRTTLTMSFDHWRKDFDAAMQQLRSRGMDGLGFYATEDVAHEDNFESRIVLHHLAHMSMHVDIVDLQIYAGARRLLGRAITRNDAEFTRKRMKNWATTARARDATFYALRFLCQVLLQEERPSMQFASDDVEGESHRTTMNNAVRKPLYSARDDHLLNRPWVLYYACLVVWSYGYALEGQLASAAMPNCPTESYAAMRAYLAAAASLKTPNELESMPNKNTCLGLLLTLHGMFSVCRWELLIEASKLLRNCVNITIGLIPN